MELKTEKDRGKKPVSVSIIEMTELVIPNDTNMLGNLLGGRMMHWMDLAGAMAASRHSNKAVATISVDNIDFRHPIRMGELVNIKAKLTWVGKTSMEVMIKAYAENLRTGCTIMTNKAFFTFVALGEDANPTIVPELELLTDEEKNDFLQGEIRHLERIKRREQ